MNVTRVIVCILAIALIAAQILGLIALGAASVWILREVTHA